MARVQGAFGDIDVDELFGLCTPDVQPGTPELFHRLSLVDRRPRALAEVRAALEAAPDHLARPLRALEARLEGASVDLVRRAFDHPFLHSRVRLREQPGDEALYGPRALSALGLARFFIGVDAMDFVLPREVFAAGGFYLPHTHAVVWGPGPVAVSSTPDVVELTFLDGARVTVPARGGVEVEHPQVSLLPRVRGVDVLNGVPEITGPVGALLEQGQNRGALPEARALAEGWRPASEALTVFEQGLQLLDAVWPEAGAATARTFRGLVAVPHKGDGSFFSLTTGRLRGALIAGLLEAVQVGDSLVHEGAHTRLWPVFEYDPLIAGEDRAEHPSPWRKDPRPLKGLLNGVHAFAQVCQYYQRLHAQAPWARDIAAQKLSLHGPRVQEAWRYLSAHAEPTPLGALLFAQLEAAVRAL